MHLISATVRNYRVHRELVVKFDRARTLIGGPNEAGKSTLIEAVHRALFFPAKSAAEPQRRMRSTLHPGNPEVELEFGVGGATFHLRKRFSGATGTTVLTQAGGQSWHAEQAEEQLARLLGIPADGSARTATERWAHLWVWQGDSGENPEHHVSGQRDALLGRLQHMGGAAAMQSPLDTKVAAQFAAARDAMLTQAGKPKAGSPLAVAEAEFQIADVARNEASDRLERLRRAMTEVEDATALITNTEGDIAALEIEHRAVGEKSQQAAALQQQLENEERQARDASTRCAQLHRADAQINELERALAQARDSALPLQQEFELRKGKRAERERLALESESAAQAAEESLRQGNLAREFAEAQMAALEKHTEEKNLASRLEEARRIEKTHGELRLKLASLPEIDPRRFKKLQQLDAERATAEATLAAIGAGIEVLATDTHVVAGGRALIPGEVHLVTEDVEVAIGSSTRLRLRPGGGRSLGEAREAAAAAQKKLKQALDDCGAGSLSAAADLMARRESILGEIKTAEARLADFDLPALTTREAELRESLAGLRTRIDRLHAELPHVVLATDLSAARESASAVEQDLRQAESSGRRCRAALQSARQALTEADAQLEQQRQACEESRRVVTVSEAQLKLLIETHGDRHARAEAITLADQALAATSEVARKTRAALESLQPALLPATATRIQRALEGKKRTLQDAETRKAVALSGLSRDGSLDPEVELANAEARLRFARERFAAQQQQVAAITLLADLFAEEQRKLADRFTRPLADRIGAYLQCIFGPGAAAVICLDENGCSGLQLVRSDGQPAVPFDSLSGGTREQVAAALRLAMAELLATEHGGTLPMVFDDSFAYSDPERVRILQGMLDLAAEKGLQIIVLTCNPADYALLGAEEFMIPRRSLQGAISTAADVAVISVSTGQSPPDTVVVDAQRELLRTVLRQFGGSKGNQSLREALGWHESEYEAVKQDLVQRGELVPGRGRGGSVLLVT